MSDSSSSPLEREIGSGESGGKAWREALVQSQKGIDKFNKSVSPVRGPIWTDRSEKKERS